MIGLVGVERVMTTKYLNKASRMVSHNNFIAKVVIHGEDKRTIERKIGSNDSDQQHKAEVVVG